MGASQRHVFTMVWRDGMIIVAAGLLCGFAASLLAMRMLRSYLFHITPADPVMALAVAAVFIAVGMIAIYAPARRAMRIDPAVALRE